MPKQMASKCSDATREAWLQTASDADICRLILDWHSRSQVRKFDCAFVRSVQDFMEQRGRDATDAQRTALCNIVRRWKMPVTAAAPPRPLEELLKYL